MNHYETAEPTPVYESIDDDLYEKVEEEKAKENQEAEKSTRQNTRKKSRSNPVYDIGEDDEELNPVVNLAVTSPSRKMKKDGNFSHSILEENESDDTTNILSTFQSRGGNPGYENVGVVNPLASHTEDGEPEEGNSATSMKNEDEDSTSSDAGQAEDSKPPISKKNELYPLEHQNSITSDDVPASPPPVYDNNELYSLGKKENLEDQAAQSSC